VVNQAQSERIEIRCVGDDVVPHNVRAGDLAGLLEAAETLIVAGVLREHPELTRDDIIIGLTEVQNKAWDCNLPHRSRKLLFLSLNELLL